MKSIKQKYAGMKHADLTKALGNLTNSISKTRMALIEDPKAYAELYKYRYERALVKTLLSMPELQ
ncbi:hypothetical protein KBB12_01025 [Candidatus Woesebacteria bacterium]|nr:hypothetical protein [Candidatus Woesebacteria bacterium]